MPPLSQNDKLCGLSNCDDNMHCIEWEWHKSLPVKAKLAKYTQIIKSCQKCQKYTELWWTFVVQAICDNINLKYQHLNPLGTSWTQELPLVYIEWH